MMTFILTTISAVCFLIGGRFFNNWVQPNE